MSSFSITYCITKTTILLRRLLFLSITNLYYASPTRLPQISASFSSCPPTSQTPALHDTNLKMSINNRDRELGVTKRVNVNTSPQPYVHSLFLTACSMYANYITQDVAPVPPLQVLSGQSRYKFRLVGEFVGKDAVYMSVGRSCRRKSRITSAHASEKNSIQLLDRMG